MTTIEKSQEIKNQYLEKKEAQPNKRIRNIAQELGYSEGEILASFTGEHVTRLSGTPQDVLEKIITLGEVMALTRNEACVHERHGIYDNSEFSSHGKMKMGLFVNPDIDLRLFLNQWAHQFAVQEAGRKSIQFFDKAGHAIHKIYITEKSNDAAYDALVSTLRSSDQSPGIEVEPYPEKAADLPDSEIDWSGLKTGWQELKDTHDFFILLKKFKAGRVQAFKNIGEDLAYKVSNTSSRDMLQLARDKSCEIMAFVGNRGCIQIHTGPVNKLMERGQWYNVLDPMFNLHLDESKIATSWVVKKPTEDGIVTSLEVFDDNGEAIITFFGKRKPGIPELELWREIVTQFKRD